MSGRRHWLAGGGKALGASVAEATVPMLYDAEMRLRATMAHAGATEAQIAVEVAEMHATFVELTRCS